MIVLGNYSVFSYAFDHNNYFSRGYDERMN